MLQPHALKWIEQIPATDHQWPSSGAREIAARRIWPPYKITVARDAVCDKKGRSK